MKNDNVSAVAEILSEKQVLLCELLKRSSDCSWDSTQELTTWVESRAEIIKDIDILDQKIESCVALCENEYPSIRKALNNSCNRGELCDELKTIFDATQHNFSILNRVKSISDEVMERINKMQDSVKDGIKQNNQKTKVVKYFPNEKIGIFRERG